VSRFLEQAIELLEGAERSAAAGEPFTEWTILITPTGAVQMLAGNDWPLASLQAHRGAGMAFRISRRAGRIRLEGRAGSRTCLFETAKPDGAARPAPAETPVSLLRPAVPHPDLPGGTLPPLAPAARS